MTGNSLYDPLGQTVVGATRRRSLVRPSTILFVGLGGFILAVGGWIGVRATRSPDPSVAIVPIGAPPASPPAPRIDPAPPAAPAPVKAVQSSDEVERESGVKVVRPPGSPGAAGSLIMIPQSDPIALPPAPDPRLAERSKYGLLPRRGADGARPALIYARPVGQAPSLAANAPRIAIFVGGMGLNRTLTAAAAQALPPAVTLGFAPYGGDLGLQVQNARDLGHEAVLQVPMESYNEPDGTTMPRMLTVADTTKDTADNLHWQMARFTGYAGVSNFLGAKFTADADAFAPVLRDVAERGLFYFDDGTAPRNLVTTLGPTLGLPTIRADVVIDVLADPPVIDAGFKKLEAFARDRGVAVGSTTGLPTAIDRIAAFAKGLAGRGIALVPVSSLAATPAPQARP